jgi:hypothetical protein
MRRRALEERLKRDIVEQKLFIGRPRELNRLGLTGDGENAQFERLTGRRKVVREHRFEKEKDFGRGDGAAVLDNIEHLREERKGGIGTQQNKALGWRESEEATTIAELFATGRIGEDEGERLLPRGQLRLLRGKGASGGFDQFGKQIARFRPAEFNHGGVVFARLARWKAIRDLCIDRRRRC